MMWRALFLPLFCVWLLCGLQGCVYPPQSSGLAEPPLAEDLVWAQAAEDCRFYRLSPYLSHAGEETCIQSRIQTIQNIVAMRSDPYFAQAQQACAFFRGSPQEDVCYRTSIQGLRMGLSSYLPR
jgi:hypothetical protein